MPTLTLWLRLYGLRPVVEFEAQRINFAWLVRLRWGAVVGQSVTVLLVHFGMHIALPRTSLLAVIGTEALSNVACMLWAHKRAVIDATLRERLAGALRARGFDTRTAANLHEELALAQAESPELAVLDLRMPANEHPLRLQIEDRRVRARMELRVGQHDHARALRHAAIGGRGARGIGGRCRARIHGCVSGSIGTGRGCTQTTDQPPPKALRYEGEHLDHSR